MVENDKLLDNVEYLRKQLLVRQSELLEARDRVKHLEGLIEELKETCKDHKEATDVFCMEIESLEKKNKDLEAENDLVRTLNSRVTVEYAKLKEELDRLKEGK